MNYLIQVGESPFPDEILKTLLLGIVPEKVAEYAIQKYDECATMEDLEKKMTEYIDRCEQLIQRGHKPLGAMMNQEESNDIQQEEPESYEDEFGYKWICTAAPGIKRQRIEESQEGSEGGKS